jgi:hypothetical protein
MLTTQRTPDIARTDRFLIIELFAKRKLWYAHAEVARLTRTRDDEIATAVREGELTPITKGTDVIYAWEDVAMFALRRWTPRMIAAALDAHGNAVPSLNRTKRIHIELPLYQIRMLHVLADASDGSLRGRLNASDIIERALHDLAECAADEMEAAIPGFRTAQQYPYLIPCDDDTATNGCCFCGDPTDASRASCNECKDRHEPIDEES